MSNQKSPRILSIQDISCVGQCSLTVALPVISACGVETAILPSSVLSTHTGGFTGFTVRDLSGDMPAITAHWVKEGITFDAVYTGYLGSAEQIDYVKAIFDATLVPGGWRIVDPAMADHGRLYSTFDMAYVDAMKRLCVEADILLPNITEACLLTGTPYRETYDADYIDGLTDKLLAMGRARTVVLTGVSYAPDTIGVVVRTPTENHYHPHRRLPKNSHGTGDVFASSFVGALMNRRTPLEAAIVAANFTLACMEYTAPDPTHWYGVKFEPLLGELIQMLRGAGQGTVAD